MNREEYTIWEAGIKTIFKPVGQNQPEQAPAPKENKAPKAGLRERIQGLASNAKRVVDDAVSKGVEQVKNVANKAIQRSGKTDNGAKTKEQLQAKHANDIQPTNKSSLAQSFGNKIKNIAGLNKVKTDANGQVKLDFKGAEKAHKEQQKAQATAVKNANLDTNGQARLNLGKTLSTADKVKNNLANTKGQVEKKTEDLKGKIKAGYKEFKNKASETVNKAGGKLAELKQKVKDTFDKSPKQLSLNFNQPQKAQTGEQLKLDLSQKRNALVPTAQSKQLPAVVSKPGTHGVFVKDGKAYTTNVAKKVADNLKAKTDDAQSNTQSNEPKATINQTNNGKQVNDNLKNSGKVKTNNGKPQSAFDIWKNIKKGNNQANSTDSTNANQTNINTSDINTHTAKEEENNEPKKSTTLGQKVKDGLNKAYDGVIRAGVKAKNLKQDIVQDYKSRKERIENEESLKRINNMINNHASNRAILDEIARIKSQVEGDKTNNSSAEERINQAREKITNANASKKATQGATQNTGTRGSSNANTQTDTTQTTQQTSDTATNNKNQTNAGTTNTRKKNSNTAQQQTNTQTEVGNNQTNTQPTDNKEPVDNSNATQGTTNVQTQQNEPVQQPEEQAQSETPTNNAEQPVSEPIEQINTTQPNTTETGAKVRLNLNRPKAPKYETDENGNVLNKNVTFKQAEVNKKADLVKTLSMRPNSQGKVVISVNGKGVDITKNASRVTQLLGNALYYQDLNKLKGNTLEGIKTELMKATNLPKAAVTAMIANVKKGNGRIGEITYKGPEVDENGIQQLPSGEAGGSVDKWSQFLRTKYKGAKQVTPYANTDVNAFVQSMSSPNFDVNNLDEKSKAIYDDLKECGLISVGQDGKSTPLFQKIDANGKIVYNPVEQTGPKAIVNGKMVDVPQTNTQPVNNVKQLVQPETQAPVQPEATAQPQEPTQQPTEQTPVVQPQVDATSQPAPVQQAPVQPVQQPTLVQQPVQPIQQPVQQVQQPVQPVQQVQQPAPVQQAPVQPVQQPVQQAPVQPEATAQPQEVEQPTQQEVEQPEVEQPTQQEVEQPEVEQEPTVDNRIEQQPVIAPSLDVNNEEGAKIAIQQYATDLDNKAKQDYDTAVAQINQNWRESRKGVKDATQIQTLDGARQDKLAQAQARYNQQLSNNRTTIADMEAQYSADVENHKKQLEEENGRNEINNNLAGDFGSDVIPTSKKSSKKSNKKEENSQVDYTDLTDSSNKNKEDEDKEEDIDPLEKEKKEKEERKNETSEYIKNLGTEYKPTDDDIKAAIDDDKFSKEIDSEKIKKHNYEVLKKDYKPEERLKELQDRAIARHRTAWVSKLGDAIINNNQKAIQQMLGNNANKVKNLVDFRNYIVNEMGKAGLVNKTKKGEWSSPTAEQFNEFIGNTTINGKNPSKYWDSMISKGLPSLHQDGIANGTITAKDMQAPFKLPENDFEDYLKENGYQRTSAENAGNKKGGYGTITNEILNTAPETNYYPGGVQKHLFKKTIEKLAQDGEYKNIDTSKFSQEVKDGLKLYKDYRESVKTNKDAEGNTLTGADIASMTNQMNNMLYYLAKNHATELGFEYKENTRNAGKTKASKEQAGKKNLIRIGKNK